MVLAKCSLVMLNSQNTCLLGILNEMWY